MAADIADIKKGLQVVTERLEELRRELDQVKEQVRLENKKKVSEGLHLEMSALHLSHARARYLQTLQRTEQELLLSLRKYEQHRSDLQQQLDNTTVAP